MASSKSEVDLEEISVISQNFTNDDAQSMNPKVHRKTCINSTNESL